jgi:2-dehydro-3-deoxyphosphogluconate aldolase/(4S)-4-hydroxy-2-oxoglutarate aldolase
VKHVPGAIVGAGGLSDVETARRCLDAGAQFLASDGLDPELVNFAAKENVVVIPGTLTPSEVLRAWKMGPDFVKVVPCAPAMGGESYVRALKAMFPHAPLIAAGGVNQQTASSFILAGAVALGIGTELIPRESIRMRQADRIGELARRFIGFVNNARSWSFSG